MLLLSLREDFARAIYAGAKRCELRKNRARVTTGERVLIYETRPRAVISGEFIVEDARRAPIETLWRWIEDSGVPREGFARYFGTRKHGFAIKIRSAHRMHPEIRLQEAVRMDPNFRPPQSYAYLSPESPLIAFAESRLPASESI